MGGFSSKSARSIPLEKWPKDREYLCYLMEEDRKQMDFDGIKDSNPYVKMLITDPTHQYIKDYVVCKDDTIDVKAVTPSFLGKLVELFQTPIYENKWVDVKETGLNMESAVEEVIAFHKQNNTAACKKRLKEIEEMKAQGKNSLSILRDVKANISCSQSLNTPEYGIFAKVDIPKGTILCSDTDMLINPRTGKPEVLSTLINDLGYKCRVESMPDLQSGTEEVGQKNYDYCDIRTIREHTNVRYVLVNKKLYVQAIKDIPAGTELSRHYGVTFWYLLPILKGDAPPVKAAEDKVDELYEKKMKEREDPDSLKEVSPELSKMLGIQYKFNPEPKDPVPKDEIEPVKAEDKVDELYEKMMKEREDPDSLKEAPRESSELSEMFSKPKGPDAKDGAEPVKDKVDELYEKMMKEREDPGSDPRDLIIA